jgi:hypothetical protein
MVNICFIWRISHLLKLSLSPFSIRCQTFSKFGAKNLKNFKLIQVHQSTLDQNNFKKKPGPENIICPILHFTFEIPKKNALEIHWNLLTGITLGQRQTDSNNRLKVISLKVK